MSLHISHYHDGEDVRVSVDMHNLRDVKSYHGGRAAWVTLKDDKRFTVTLHVDHELARRISDAFEDYENWLSSREGPTYDDALAAKVSATVRESQARALK